MGSVLVSNGLLRIITNIQIGVTVCPFIKNPTHIEKATLHTNHGVGMEAIDLTIPIIQVMCKANPCNTMHGKTAGMMHRLMIKFLKYQYYRC